MFDLPENAILYASDSHGVYIPQYFAKSVDTMYLSGVTDEDMAILLAGPDHEHYWDAWNDVECSAVLTDDAGKEWVLYQDGDLWLLPKDWTPSD